MDPKTTLVITAFVAAVVIGAATMIVKPVYAPGGNCVGCASPFAPGHLKTFIDPVPASPYAPGHQEGPANQFAPGQVKP